MSGTFNHSGGRPPTRRALATETVYDDSYFDLLKENGPRTIFQKVLFPFKRWQWARRLIGGIWQGFVTMQGTHEAQIRWLRVAEPVKNVYLPLYRTEKYS